MVAHFHIYSRMSRILVLLLTDYNFIHLRLRSRLHRLWLYFFKIIMKHFISIYINQTDLINTNEVKYSYDGDKSRSLVGKPLTLLSLGGKIFPLFFYSYQSLNCPCLSPSLPMNSIDMMVYFYVLLLWINSFCLLRLPVQFYISNSYLSYCYLCCFIV